MAKIIGRTRQLLQLVRKGDEPSFDYYVENDIFLHALKDSDTLGVIVINQLGQIKYANNIIHIKTQYNVQELYEQEIEAVIEFNPTDVLLSQSVEKVSGAFITHFSKRIEVHAEINPIWDDGDVIGRLILIKYLEDNKRYAPSVTGLKKYAVRLSELFPSSIFSVNQYGKITCISEELLEYCEIKSSKLKSGLYLSDLFGLKFSESLISNAFTIHQDEIYSVQRAELRRKESRSILNDLMILPDTNKDVINEIRIIDLTYIENVLLGVYRSVDEKINENNRLKEAFLTNISHEIRTPVNGILGLAYFLIDEELSIEEKTEYISIIKKNSNTLVKIIDDILDFSRMEAGEYAIYFSEFNLNSFLESKYHDYYRLKQQEERKNVQLLLAKGQEGDLNVIGDKHNLERVLNILMENAIKFTEKGIVEFGYTVMKKNEIHFFVKDDGVGIPESMRKTIFDRFRQVDEDLTRKFGGIGIGLSIAKKITELMQGDLWIEPDNRRGTTFVFKLKFKDKEQVSG